MGGVQLLKIICSGKGNCNDEGVSHDKGFCNGRGCCAGNGFSIGEKFCVGNGAAGCARAVARRHRLAAARAVLAVSCEGGLFFGFGVLRFVFLSRS